MFKVSVLALAVVSASTYANTSDIEKITVSATRSAAPISTVPATITVIDAADIGEQLAHTADLSQILGNLVPSFSPSRQKLSSAGETLRGREPLYMIDGVPQSNPLRNGSRDGRTIDPAMIERIEVISGANAIQGLGASGGIINIVTKSAADEQSQFSAGINMPTSGGSDSFSWDTSYLYSHSQDDVDVIAGVSARSNGVFRDGNGDIIGIDGTQGDIQDSDSLDLFLKTKWRIDAEQSLQVMLNHYQIESNGDYVPVAGDVDAGIPSTSIKGDYQGEAPENEVTTVSLDYVHANLAGGTLNWQLFYQDFSGLYGGGVYGVFQDPQYGEDLFDQSENNSEKLGSRVTYILNQVANTGFDVIGGLDLMQDTTYQELVQTGRNWVPETEFFNAAPFVQLRYSGVESLTVNVGSRYEYGKLKVDDFTTLASYGSQNVEGGEPSFNELLFNAGAVYDFTDAWRAFASYSEGFSMPDVGRVLRGIDQPNQSVDSFLNLSPILSDNKEVGLEYGGDKLTVSASYYESDSDLGARLQADQDGIFSVKRERTEISGFEASASYDFSRDTVLGLTYSKPRGRFDSDGDNQVDSDLGGANIAPERLNVSWQQQWQADISSRLQVNQLFSRDFDDGTEFDGYATVDLSLMWQTNRYGDFTLGLNNMLDKQFITYYSQTNPSNGRYFAGQGRVVALNWRTAF